jgi:hypothetical protein
MFGLFGKLYDHPAVRLGMKIYAAIQGIRHMEVGDTAPVPSIDFFYKKEDYVLEGDGRGGLQVRRKG